MDAAYACTATFDQVQASCTYGVSPTSASVGSGDATGNLAVSTSGGCGWTASSSASWLTITGGARGSGTGTVTYTVEVNTAVSVRTATLAVTGESVVVTQEAAQSPLPASLTLTIVVDEHGGCPNGDAGTIATRLAGRGGGKGKKRPTTEQGDILLALSGTERLEVLDGSACDGTAARFTLPPNGTRTTVYTVWVKAFGSRDVNDQLTTCGTDPSDGATVCSTENALQVVWTPLVRLGDRRGSAPSVRQGRLVTSTRSVSQTPG